jgi:hypothetical protein
MNSESIRRSDEHGFTNTSTTFADFSALAFAAVSQSGPFVVTTEKVFVRQATVASASEVTATLQRSEQKLDRICGP